MRLCKDTSFSFYERCKARFSGRFIGYEPKFITQVTFHGRCAVICTWGQSWSNLFAQSWGWAYYHLFHCMIISLAGNLGPTSPMLVWRTTFEQMCCSSSWRLLWRFWCCLNWYYIKTHSDIVVYMWSDSAVSLLSWYSNAFSLFFLFC